MRTSFSLEIPKERGRLENLGTKWEDNVEIDLKDTGRECVDYSSASV
jgi:hypothetical protein